MAHNEWHVDPVCRVCVRELLPSNHNSPLLFCHLLYTVSVNIFAEPKPGPKGLDSAVAENRSSYPGMTRRGTAQAAQRRAESGAEGPGLLPRHAEPAAARAGGDPGPGSRSTSPALFCPQTGHQPAGCSARDRQLPKPARCERWCLPQEPGQAQLPALQLRATQSSPRRGGILSGSPRRGSRRACVPFVEARPRQACLKEAIHRNANIKRGTGKKGA